jgi:Uncharacterized protein conserved in bacteria with the myosin-like domain
VYGIWLVLVLVLMGGGIAYLGDKIGMLVGRRRLTLFGLRPKHSSVIVTVMTGTLIAGTSLSILAVASHDVRTALFHMKEIQESLETTQNALLSSEEELYLLREMLSRQRAEVQEFIDARDTAVAERDAALAELESLEAELEQVQAALDEAQADLENWKWRVASLQELGQTLEDNVRKMQATEAKLRADIAALSEQLIALEGRLRLGAFAYLKDEIVAATVIRGGDREAAERELLAFLEEADRAALERGARIEGKERAIELAGEEHFFEAVDVLAADSREWVVRAVAQQNTVQGEPLLVYLHLFPETMIYQAGQVIRERVLDGGRRDLESLILGLLDEVNRDAIEKGMITSPQGDVGQLAGEEFVEALLNLRRVSGKARLSVIAENDTWNTKGPLEIRLRVEPVG